MKKKLFTWSRDGITSCNCSDKAYRHVHCPCYFCNGQAADRHTEFRHWKSAKLASEARMSEDSHFRKDNLGESSSSVDDNHITGTLSDEGENIGVLDDDNVNDKDSDVDVNDHIRDSFFDEEGENIFGSLDDANEHDEVSDVPSQQETI